MAKVRDGDELEAITSREDPQGRAKELNGKWGIKDRLAIGKLVDGYKIVRCPYITIQRGDFVEMLLEVSVVSGGTKQHVQFNLQQIIRIEEKARDTVSHCLLFVLRSTSLFASTKESLL